MKVIHVITGLGVGGAESVLCRFVESTEGRSIRNTVVSLSSDLRLAERLQAAGADVICIDMKRLLSFRSNIAVLRRIIEAEDPDIVQGWMYHGNLAATLATKGLQASLFWGVRQCLYDLSDEKMLTRQVIRLNARLSARPSRIIYNSLLAAEHHETIGFCSQSREIIPNGFDIESLAPNDEVRRIERTALGISDRDFAVGMVGRYHPVKDHRSFIDGVAQFRQTCPDTKVVLVGSGVTQENPQLMQELETSGLADCAVLCGERSDVHRLLNAMDVAVSMSRSESFPNVVGEGMANGRLCIATDVGDVGKMMNGTGFLIPAGDTGQLVAALQEARSMGLDGRRRAGNLARRTIMERYSLESMIERMIGCYTSVRESTTCVA